MNHTNPAFRLLSILEEGKTENPNLACKAIWGKLLKAKPDSYELLIRIGKVMELPSLIVASLKDAYPEEPSTWQHWYTQVHNSFTVQQLNGPWNTFISGIDAHSYTYLRMHAKLLQIKSKTSPLDNSILEKTRTELNECLENIISAELDIEVKAYLARNIRKLIAAIDEYHITGTTAIFDSIEILMGHQVFDPKYKTYIRETEIGNKISSIVGTIADAMSIVMGLPQIGSSINTFLGK